MADSEDFQQTSSGAANVIPAQCSSLRKGHHVMLKGHPCKVVEMSTSKTGKHGHAKVHIVGLDVFDGKKYEENCPSTHNIDTPNVTTKQFQILDLDEDDDHLCLMDDNGECRDDLKYDPAFVKDNISIKALKEMQAQTDDETEVIMAIVMSAMDKEIVIEVKKKKNVKDK